MRTRFYVIIAGLIGCTFGGCEKDTIVPQYNGFGDDYLQLQLGTNWLYKVDSVFETSGGVLIADSYYVKETIIDSIQDGRTLIYSIDKVRNSDILGKYQWFDNYTLTLTDDRIIHNGADFKAIILTTPLVPKRSWMSAYDYSYDPTSTIESVHDFETINGKEYEKVVWVQHFFEFQFDYRRHHFTRFAKGVGVVEEMFYYGYYNRLANSLTSTTLTKSLLKYAY
ncbi:MAG: hypothetical protein ACI8SE_002239 [Bacteroidia bacterium]|jgi:hypothetical protein